ncbi:zinc-dependent peptidase [Shewanella gelidii]|uniref:Zinc-dependent peptidase n=1 Tax=Shewanella gelidii TaxID=1642821 RepID=A0A917N6C0_9GAMM|nr:M90 family metallopeptidase [Shewanella gelidii]MCL1096529.1 zinc-dependent peptidase [Shewanella gelidii]GGI68128.1 hypothetical protein GCM10009332_01610 [Shewanella gelidii]
MLSFILMLILGCVAIAWLVTSPQRAQYRRRKVVSSPFPTRWRHILKKRFPYFLSMPADLQLQLKKHIQVFIHEKEFVGCEGIQINDEVKVTIAAQACLLLLNRQTGFYPQLKQILVYPSAFITENEQTDASGVVWYNRRVLSGESWENGKVILSWHDTLVGAAAPFDGNNVVIHEFAHQLDQESGSANGAPILATSKDYQQWSKVLSQEFEALKHCVATNTPSLFDNYGATNPAEFFAVVSEVFFEQSQSMAAQYPELYKQLSQFYRLDPINWH